LRKIGIKEINRLAVPAIIAGIAEPVITLVDTAFIGRLGTAELAGVGIAASFYLMIIWILAQTKSAISAIVSRYYGKQRLDEIDDLIPQAFFLNALLGLLVIAITTPLATPIFKLYLAKGDVMTYAKSYYYIRSWGYPITLSTFILFGVFRGLQNTSWAMKIALIGGAVNVVGDYILIFGMGPIPEMGVEGAALASLMSQVVMLILAIVYLYKNTRYRIYFVKKVHKDLKWLFSMSKDFYVRTISLNLALYQTTRMASALGDAAMAAHTIAMNIWLFSAFFIDGYANAANALSGRLFGERNMIGLRSLTRKVVWISIGIGILLGTVYAIGYRAIPSIFTNDPIVKYNLYSIFWIVIIMQPINAIAFAYDGIFKGLGEAKLLRNSLLFSTFFVFFPFVWLTKQYDWGLYAVWGSLLVWMMSRGGSLMVLFRQWIKPYI
jgi:putative MATE family efflux protein